VGGANGRRQDIQPRKNHLFFYDLDLLFNMLPKYFPKSTPLSPLNSLAR
jgi:hypothetical protein